MTNHNTPIKEKVVDPKVMVEALTNNEIILFGDVEDGRGNIFGLGVLNPKRVPKGGGLPIFRW
jgi:hypothetical protein